MDHEYLGKIDIMEQQNRDYQKEIEKLKLARDGEKQKLALTYKDAEKLHNRIAEFEMANKKNENLAGERQQQLQYEVELKEQQVRALQE